MRRLLFLLLASAALLPLAHADDEPPAYDLLITGGRVVDGTGNPWFKGDVAIKGDRIAAVGAVKGKAKRTIGVGYSRRLLLRATGKGRHQA